MRVRQIVKQAVRGTALERPARWVDLWLTGNRDFLYNEQTEQIISRVLNRDSNAVDVGAHKGEILKTIVKVAPSGRHFAFEPVPALCEELKRLFPQVEVHQTALCDHSGEERFVHVLSNPGYSGLKQRQYRYVEAVQEISVKTARLDDILPEATQISLIKIDVEGAELQVLRGAEGVLRRNHPVVIFEHEPGGALSYGTQPSQVCDFLDQCGLRVYLMCDWLQGRSPITKEELRRQFFAGKNYCFVAAPWNGA